MSADNKQQCFPCIEQPARCFFSSIARDRRLSSSKKDGQVLSSHKRSEREQFTILPQGRNIVMIQSSRNGCYLRSYEDRQDAMLQVGQTEGRVYTTQNIDEASLWVLQRSPDNIGFYFTCMDDNRNLGCDEEGNIFTSHDNGHLWSIEFQTGELCFVCAAAVDKRLRCDLIGNISLTDNCKGWEVWRFIEAGQGVVRVSAWMHHKNYLCSDPEGRVYTTVNPKDDWDMWTVEKDLTGNDGVIIKSAVHGRVLSFSDESIFTDDEHKGEFGTWQLEAAHSQKYTLCCHCPKKKVGPFPYVTDNNKQAEEWKLEGVGDNGSVTFFSQINQKYLGSKQDGDVCMEDDANESTLWLMRSNRVDGYVFVSEANQRALSFHDCGEKDATLCTVPGDDYTESEMWRLEPCMPRAVSGGKIKTFAIGSTAALATTIAMPFAVAGVVGLIGAEVGILADIVVVGLTGAEAIASIGVVGTTAALVFSESGGSISSTQEENAPEEIVNRFTKRPFCAWRTW